ncbi:aminotransferase class IV family protein [Sunxiuqinia elliptica]|uniref:4-amino-4-deoxychorismate lyase n=1 Tax=Sunxiuqinia elliptica TaxID=655355 RepID=A0A4R6GWL1_9BACT|nr:aminotransferase class IV family protein [Sunxiuqinia elliptica]TDN99154.1 4-amino-4-deoxychorismate lyase [Sunxiuqinia elliptica]TDO56594.1 4-amino-4-deoxychorismate lyase [Sunxiuqinia elliptica]
MSLLLETIKIENGKLLNMVFHNWRFNQARRELFNLPEIDLEQVISIPDDLANITYRCRVLYDQTIQKVEFIPYQTRSIQSLRLVYDDIINYAYKYANRTHLNELFKKRGNADEIIIVKKGLITDCTIGNLVFYDGEKWLTPEQPLLAGTQRQKLLSEGQIKQAKITEKDLSNYQKVGIINAFYLLDNMPSLPINKINNLTKPTP